MKIATFNANSVRARMPIILDWLEANQPDVLAIQETKVDDEHFPLADFEDLGWTVAFHGQKSYNGVAFVSRVPLARVTTGFGDPLMPEDCRLIAADLDGVVLVNTYVPNGSAVGSEKFSYKLKWLERLKQFFALRYSAATPILWMGDINIAPKPEDVYDSAKVFGGVGHHPSEFAALARVVDWGFEDLFRKHTTGPGHFTYWDFVVPKALERGLGWRIDHIYATAEVSSRCRSCTIDTAPRLQERPSDHTFVIAEFD